LAKKNSEGNAMTTSAPPEMLDAVKRLIEEHREIKDEPLLLAVYFEPERDPGDLFLFEVVEGFGANRVQEDRELFEVSYYSTPQFPLGSEQRLHLVLTNPVEFEAATQAHWPSLEEVRNAMRDGRAKVLFADPARPDLEAKLRA
jgi:hypothetical protein